MTTLRKFLQDWREVGVKDRSLTDDEIIKVVKDWIRQAHTEWKEKIQYEELYVEEVLPLLAKRLDLSVQKDGDNK